MQTQRGLRLTDTIPTQAAPHTKNQLKMFCEQLMKNCSTALFKSTYANFCSNLVKSNLYHFLEVLALTPLAYAGMNSRVVLHKSQMTH